MNPTTDTLFANQNSATSDKVLGTPLKAGWDPAVKRANGQQQLVSSTFVFTGKDLLPNPKSKGQHL